MSRWGRGQDALYYLYEEPGGYSTDKPGIVQELGISFEQWSRLIEPILEAVVPVFDTGPGPEPATERARPSALITHGQQPETW